MVYSENLLNFDPPTGVHRFKSYSLHNPNGVVHNHNTPLTPVVGTGGFVDLNRGILRIELRSTTPQVVVLTIKL